MSSNEETKDKAVPGSRQVNYPAVTWDFRLHNSSDCGLGLVAARNIKKGALVFSDSYEFMFTDVQDGDILRFDRHEKASKRSEEDVPATFPLTRELLTHTHGVPCLKEDENDPSSAGTITWKLECPGMLINHSCDPNLRDDSHDSARGEAFATRDIKKGEQLTYDYTYQYYDHGPFFEKCLCGAERCRGSMTGFKDLSEEDKQKVLPYVSEAVKAMHEADQDTGLPVKHEEATFPPRVEKDVLQLVVPGPGHACADISIQRDETTGAYQLVAEKDFATGDSVYEFFTQRWPDGKKPIDMVSSTFLLPGDLEEGTTVRVDPMECAKRNRKGQLIFSGFDLFTTHSCEPNVVYNDKKEDEDDDWRGAYASRPILKGEQLSVDFNTLLWDRTEWEGLGEGTCTCGASKCRGTVKGFRFLSPEDQQELVELSWNRAPPPHARKGKKRVTPGEALVPHVRASWREYADSAPSGIGLTSSSSDDSSDEE